MRPDLAGDSGMLQCRGCGVLVEEGDPRLRGDAPAEPAEDTANTSAEQVAPQSPQGAGKRSPGRPRLSYAQKRLRIQESVDEVFEDQTRRLAEQLGATDQRRRRVARILQQRFEGPLVKPIGYYTVGDELECKARR